MHKSDVIHATTVVERQISASCAQVFAAFQDPPAHGKWNVPGENFKISKFEHDFRVGGRELSVFGPPGGPSYTSDGFYIDIVQNERIVSAGAMHSGDIRSSATLCTVEMHPHGDSTHVVVTDQSSFFRDETPQMRESGWRQILDRLESQLVSERT